MADTEVFCLSFNATSIIRPETSIINGQQQFQFFSQSHERTERVLGTDLVRRQIVIDNVINSFHRDLSTRQAFVDSFTQKLIQKARANTCNDVVSSNQLPIHARVTLKGNSN